MPILFSFLDIKEIKICFGFAISKEEIFLSFMNYEIIFFLQPNIVFVNAFQPCGVLMLNFREKKAFTLMLHFIFSYYYSSSSSVFTED